jgi:hypothetical protein
MISLNDFTPTELHTLAELMLAHNRAELHSVQSTHTGGPLPQRAVARYDRQHAVATALNVEAERRENRGRGYSVILDQPTTAELIGLASRAPVTVTRIDDGKVELTSAQPMHL